jgi:flagellin-like hook-associated protein FlgL
LSELDFDVQQSFNLTVNYTDGVKTFSSAIALGIEDTLGGVATLSAEEAQSIIVQGSVLTSLQAYAAKDANQGTFVLLEQGDYQKFTIASDGTLTSVGELRMSNKPVLDVFVEYQSDTIDSYVEHIEITLTPTSYDHSRSTFSATESGSVVIIPQINQFLANYAAADNYAGRFEISQSPYTSEPDYNFFDIDSGGRITSKGRLDFEEGQTEFEVTVFYHHSSGSKKYTDFRRLEITNDRRDDNNLALEGINISTREGAANAAELLNEVIVRISGAQAKLGAIENRFTHNIDNLSINILKSEQANGRIIDADYATESTRLARSQILDQAATNMLVGANQAKQNLLMLIQ